MATLELEVSTTTPEPGIYPDVEARHYHRWEAASNSALSHLLRSPAHLRAALDHPKAPTEDQALGTAAHTLILESERFGGLYTVAEQCAAVTGKGEPCSNPGKLSIGGAWYCGTHLKGKEGALDTRTVLAPDAWEKVNRMAEAVLSHPAAAALLALAGDTEVSLVWDDPATGVRCKGRPDRLCGSDRLIVDLKTTTDASREAFEKSIYNFGYFRQAAFYLDGLAQLDVHCSDFVFIAVEKTEPFGVGVYRIADQVLNLARGELQRLLAIYAECESSGRWPCYSGEIIDIGLPRWAYSHLEEV